MRPPYQVAKALALILAVASLAYAAQLRQIAMIELPGNAGFGEVVFANGYLVIAHGGDNSIDVFDPQKRRVVTQVFGMHEPRGIAVDDPGGKIYVANAGDKTIAVVSSKDWKLVDTIKLTLTPDPVQLSADGKTLYVGEPHSQSISAVSLARGNQVSTVPVGGSPRGMVFDAARNVVLVTLEDTREVIAVDPELRVVARYPLAASMPTGIALDAHGRRVFVAVRSAVVELDADSGKELKRVAAPAGVNALWFDPAGGMLYTAGGGSVMLINAANGRFDTLQELQVKVRGQSLAYDAARKFVFIPGGQEGRSKLLLVRSIDNAAATAQPQTQSMLR